MKLFLTRSQKSIGDALHFFVEFRVERTSNEIDLMLQYGARPLLEFLPKTDHRDAFDKGCRRVLDDIRKAIAFDLQLREACQQTILY